MTKLHKTLILAAIPILVWIFPAPDGLPLIAWRLFGIYLATIVGLVLKPYGEPVILLAAVALSSIVIGNTEGASKLVKVSQALSGYQSGTTWLIFTAFTLSSAFVITGLGKRIAYHLIGWLGNTTLRLGYVTMFLDLLLSPATPSNTARAGGIIFPIINSVAVALGSTPNESPKRAGRFLLMNVYMVVKSTSYIFLTAMAPNALALSLMAPILGFKMDWLQWFLAASIPGLLCLFLIPLVCYFTAPPELKQVDNKAISDKGLAELGPMSFREKALAILFVLALLCWIFADTLGVNATTVALSVMVLCVVLSIVSWDDILKNKAGWNTLIWYGGIIGMSTILDKAGFFKWLANVFEQYLNFGDNSTLALVVILFTSVAVRYLFASGGAYVAAMVPVFATVGKVAGAPVELLTIGLLFANAYGGSVTHYGGGPGPITFGAGYNDIKSWWIAGAIVAFGSLIIHCTIGVAWWNFLLNLGWL
ncbi:membrane protein [Avibacterium paragallinarum]|uniref:Anion permease n=1 Tax=Avibacterium paragallinarum TaxID=728 RepID=A0A0F5EYM2_AVIPA|nr:anion permease [Avibacterium paragallinarum]KAA6208612.1 anion permease [Avibacterium paragallinarum]KKB01724.1 membrane protein [Avibacterium paragallinarum]RZN57612.1 anion permease [Avibacterium paragallinarum]RZN70058.1 anion permease [Avibacterium paragallinarum]TID11255.1 membrane protein [Avibacterium paragallinarum]